LAENLDACRWVYNRLLEDLNGSKEKGIKLKTYDTQNMIPYLKLENPKPIRVYSKLQPIRNNSSYRKLEKH
jgi:putative transposase